MQDAGEPAGGRGLGGARRRTGGRPRPRRRGRLDLDREEERRLALVDLLELVQVPGVPLGQARQLVAELQQQLQPVGAARPREVLGDLGQGAGRAARYGEARVSAVTSRSGRARRCPTRSTSRRSCAPCRSPAGGSARTTCARSARRCGSTRRRRRRASGPARRGRSPRGRRGDLNVPSSSAARAHGTDFAPGMCPPRIAPSCG